MSRLLYLPAVLAVAAGVAEAGAGRPVIAKLQGQVSGVIRNDSTHAATGPNTFTLELNGVAVGTPLSLRLVGPDGRVINAPVKPIEAVAEEGHGHGATAEDSHDAVASESAVAAAAATAAVSTAAAAPSEAPQAEVHAEANPHDDGDDHADDSGHAATPVDDHAAEASDEHPSGTLEFHSEGAADDHAAGTADDHGTAVADDHSEAATDDHASPVVEDHATPVDSPEVDGATPADEHAESSSGHGGEADEHGPATTFAGWTKVSLSEGDWKAEVLSGGEVRSVTSFTVTYGGPSPYYLTVAGGLIVGFLLLGITNRVLLARQVSR